MVTYTVRRLLQALPTIVGITIISFIIIMSAPGDPIAMLSGQTRQVSPDAEARLRRQLGLDQPITLQYLYWLIGNDWTSIDVDGDGTGDITGSRQGILRGDFGSSFSQQRPVMELIVERIPATLQLTGAAFVMGYGVGILLGLLAAGYHRSWIDQLVRIVSVVGSAVPDFWLALLLIMFFSVSLKLLPMGGMRDIGNPNATVIDNLKYMIMPVTVLAFGTIASVARYLRTKMLDVLSQDYVRTAQAKGLRSRTVWWQHAFRNAVLPLATFVGPALGSLFTGAVIVETIFSWPGMGRLIVNAVFERDYPLIMGTIMMTALLYIGGLIISDVLYVALDPRIRLR